MKQNNKLSKWYTSITFVLCGMFNKYKFTGKIESNDIAFVIDAHLGDFIICLNFINFVINKQRNKGKIYMFVSKAFADFLKETLKWEEIEYIYFQDIDIYDKDIVTFKQLKNAAKYYSHYKIKELYMPYTNMWAIKFSYLIPCNKRCIIVHSQILEKKIKYKIVQYMSSVCVVWDSRKEMLFESIKQLALQCDFQDYVSKCYRINLVNRNNKTQPYCIIAPGCTNNIRSLKIEKFIKIIDSILSETSLLVYLSGDKNDKKITNHISEFFHSDRVIDFAGKTELKELTFLLSNADFLLSNDTGIIHLAALVGTPTFYIGTLHNKRCVPYILDEYNINIFEGIWYHEPLKCQYCEVPHAQNNIERIPNELCQKTLREEGCFYCIKEISSDEIWNKICKYIKKRA